MIRVGSQFTFCSPHEILRRTVVEQDEQSVTTRLFSLDESSVESSHTMFFDGILSAEIISLKQHIFPGKIAQFIANYQYIDLSVEQPVKAISPNSNPLLLDFGSKSPDVINSLFTHRTNTLAAFSIFEIIAACTYYPALLLGQPATLTENRCTQLLLWEGIDLVNKKFTERTRIRVIK